MNRSDAGAWTDRLAGLPDPERDARFYAGVPARRLVAFAVDIVLVWGAAILFGVLTLGIGFLLLGPVVAVGDFLYRTVTISNGSATFGMRLMRIELRDRDGERFGLFEAVGHTLLLYLALTFVLVQLISVIMMAGSAQGRGLHDVPFGSAMINSPA